LYLRGGGVEFSVFPYTQVMASNTAYCTTVHTRDNTGTVLFAFEYWL